MESVHLLDIALTITFFLLGTTLLHLFSEKISFPYTVSLLIVGFVSQFLFQYFHIEPHISLSPDFTYFFLLPILLFEAAVHINIHQFKLQFKTITFLATFGLLVSIFVIAFGLAYLIHLPFEIALLFATIISATDPIAVLALFKTLGAPKRLALIAEGESMFNDATAVIAFRLVSGFVLADTAFGSKTLFQSTGNFLYVFFGSIIFGVILGYLFSLIIQWIKADRIITTTIITALALGSFSIAEHFLHLSGVMTTVFAGLIFGMFAQGKIKNQIVLFIQEYFRYLGFLALSLVFFFASFTLDVGLFTKELPIIFIVIFVVLLARAISVYLTAFISNHTRFFKNEPNIPMSWQHILNWGGLRGVIPLVLVYSLPDTFIYKEMMLRFALATLVFTLFVNGLTIKKLLTILHLHLQKKEEKIIQDELRLFSLAETRKKLKELPEREFTQSVIDEIDKDLQKKETFYKRDLIEISDPQSFLRSLKLQSIAIERETLYKLFEKGRFSEGVLYEFESELDLQQDGISYPALYQQGPVGKEGIKNTHKSFRKRLFILRRFVLRYKLLSKMLQINEKDIIAERYSLLRARTFTSYAVLDYLKRLETFFPHKKIITNAIKETEAIQNSYIEKNQQEINKLSLQYPELVTNYQQKIINQLISQ